MSERLYEELASWWGVLCAPEESQHQATCLHGLLTQGLGRLPQTLLELGSGAGHLVSCFPETVACTLVDRAQGMLDETRVIRSEGDRGELFVVDVERILEGEAANFHLEPGDVIFVPTTRLTDWNLAIQQLLPTLQGVSAVLNPFVQIKFLQRN